MADVASQDHHTHEKNFFVSDLTKSSYHPGRSGSVNLKSEKGPHLAYFGELHPAIVKNLDFKGKNIFGYSFINMRKLQILFN